MKLFKNFKSFFFCFVAFAICSTLPTYLSAQDPVLSDPGSYVNPANTSLLFNAITAVVTVFVGYFSASIPGLRNLSNKAVRIIVTSIVVVAGAGAFKFGFLTKETFTFVVTGFLPNFGGSAFAYEVLKYLLKLIGIDIKTPQPTPASA